MNNLIVVTDSANVSQAIHNLKKLDAVILTVYPDEIGFAILEVKMPPVNQTGLNSLNVTSIVAE